MKAVIIAAGSGSRLESRHNGVPKTLLKIHDRSILDVILDGVRHSGISEVVVVTGYKADVLEKYLKERSSDSLSLSVCYNPAWRLSNGISLLSAETVVKPGEEFVLLMSDHIFQKEMLKLVINTEIEQSQVLLAVDFKLGTIRTRVPRDVDAVLLAVDFKLGTIPDIGDGMKVKCGRLGNGLYEITGLDKGFTEYQAIDCGMFKMSHDFFGVLRKSIENGRTSLSDSCNVLAANGRMLGVDIGESRWIDIDTPEMFGFHSIISCITENIEDENIK